MSAVGNSVQSSRYKIPFYFATTFLASGALLVLELVAARLIAPYVGVSLYTWTTIIGVILAGLSIGNWLGGYWADRGHGDERVGWVLLVSGVFSFLSLYLIQPVASLVQPNSVGILASTFLYVSSMFLVPSIALGVVTPLLTTIAARERPDVGRIIGGMHALAALGSITGVFLTGYLLVQYFGTRQVVFGVSILLLLLCIPYFFRNTLHASLAGLVVLFTAAMLTALTHQTMFAKVCKEESAYYCINVVDRSQDVSFGVAQGLVLDHLLHGINHKSEPGYLVAAFAQAIDEIVFAQFQQDYHNDLRYFFAGGGSYTLPRAIKSTDHTSKITVAEIDERVTAVSSEQLFVDMDDFRVIHQDARVALSNEEGEFDVVVTDVFHDISIPYHMVTKEFSQQVKGKLSSRGIYLMNVVDQFPDPKLVKSILKTLREVFLHVGVWMDHVPNESTRFTYVISANDDQPFPNQIIARRGLERSWLNVSAVIEEIGTPMGNLPVLTDSYSPVERLMSGLLIGPSH